MPSHASPRIALVTGASRGIGADIALRLAHPDTHVIVNYRENTDHAAAVAGAIRTSGGCASTAAADICDEAAVTTMIDDIAQRFGRLDTVILNAVGGLAQDVDPGTAMRINRAAQRRLARLALPLMPAGGHIVFVTSHQAHFYPNKAVPKGSAPLAAGKRAGETTLQAMSSEFHTHRIHFTVVSTEITDETGAEFADAIAHVATSGNPAGIVYVGGSHDLQRRSA